MYLVICYTMGLQTVRLTTLWGISRECFLSAAAHNYEQFFNIFINIFAYYNRVLSSESSEEMTVENQNVLELKFFDGDDDTSNGFGNLVEEITNDLYLERDELDADKIFRNLIECWSSVNKIFDKDFDKIFSLFEQYLSHEYYKRYPEDDPTFQFNPLNSYNSSMDLSTE